ncbi:MAG TPA: hypothetical protein VMW75_09650 [Thermoanaerobaculia bacterium]|nr:hypothetical protein [Thermoanaerobaculia bacterium]
MARRSLAALQAAARPRRWLLLRRPLAERRQALGELAGRAAGDARAARAVNQAWTVLLREGNGTLLADLASQIERYRLGFAVENLVASFSVAALAEDPARVREAAVRAVATLGLAAVPSLARALLNGDVTAAAWALLGLRRIGLGKAMEALAAWGRDAGAEARERLAERLASTSQQSWGDLIDGLAAGLGGAAEARDLARQVLSRLDPTQLERECQRLWVAQRSSSSRTLLAELFDYAQEGLQ